MLLLRDCSWPLRSYSSMDVQVNSEKELRQLQRENSRRLLQRIDSQNKQLSSLISSLRSEREEENKELSSLISSIRSESEEGSRPGYLVVNSQGEEGSRQGYVVIGREGYRKARRGSSGSRRAVFARAIVARGPVDQSVVVVDQSVRRVSP